MMLFSWRSAAAGDLRRFLQELQDEDDLLAVKEEVDPEMGYVIWAESTRCEPGTSEFLFDEYGNIPLIPYIGHGVKPEHNHKKVVKCCMLPLSLKTNTLHGKLVRSRAPLLLMSRQRWIASGRSVDLPVMFVGWLALVSNSNAVKNINQFSRVDLSFPLTSLIPLAC